MLSLLAFIFVLGLLVVCHEFGHFLFARIFKVRVFSFAIGYGPKLWSKTSSQTEYSIRLFPLGGFVKMAGMGDNVIEGHHRQEVSDAERFDKKPLWQRSMIVVAGPLMNICLSIVLVFIVFTATGVPTGNLEIQQVMEGGPAERAGIRAGDVVFALNGITFDSVEDVAGAISASPGEEIVLSIRRNSETIFIPVTPEWNEEENRALIQVVFGMESRRTNPFLTLGRSVTSVFGWFALSVAGLFSTITGQIPLQLTGPIGIAQMAGQAAQVGFLNLLMFASLISIFLALFNLLPIPILDGGHLVLFAYEKIKKKPLDPDKVGIIYLIGVVFLILLAVFVTYQDFTRILVGQ
ncbi:MAG TPA: RIP metalloprotease RseP [Atribacteraceae bacterium]|nr:RIP metalloprotease RseP [Atribacteraceae bacterium]